jgi:hypothetical protein
VRFSLHQTHARTRESFPAGGPHAASSATGILRSIGVDRQVACRVRRRRDFLRAVAREYRVPGKLAGGRVAGTIFRDIPRSNSREKLGLSKARCPARGIQLLSACS